MNELTYLLLGLGIGNLEVKKYFDKENIKYIIYDDKVEEYKNDIDFNSFDVVVKSSGIKDEHFLVRYAKILNKEIITDLELFYRYTKAKKFITVTGTNGKTTTVSLIHHILSNLDLGGNIGYPLFKYVESDNDIIIEASSFMLEHTKYFHSDINIYTNIYINHLDHHGSLENYIKSKLKLIKNIKKEDFIIYNYDNLILRRIFENYHYICKILCFSSKEQINGVYLVNNDIYLGKEFLMNLNDIKLLGEHNKENILAAICAVIAYDVKRVKDITKINDFCGVEHRIEYLGKINDIRIYNDSKSTNYQSLKTALNTFKDEKILLICGGKKRVDNIEILNNNLSRIKKVLVNGENQDDFNQYFSNNNLETFTYKTLDLCLDDLLNHLDGIDVILFSPGASSYDQFKNFEERGVFFKNKISELGLSK